MGAPSRRQFMSQANLNEDKTAMIEIRWKRLNMLVSLRTGRRLAHLATVWITWWLYLTEVLAKT